MMIFFFFLTTAWLAPLLNLLVPRLLVGECCLTGERVIIVNLGGRLLAWLLLFDLAFLFFFWRVWLVEAVSVPPQRIAGVYRLRNFTSTPLVTWIRGVSPFRLLFYDNNILRGIKIFIIITTLSKSIIINAFYFIIACPGGYCGLRDYTPVFVVVAPLLPFSLQSKLLFFLLLSSRISLLASFAGIPFGSLLYPILELKSILF